MRLRLALAWIALLLVAAALLTLRSPSFAQIAPAITTTPSRPPLYLPIVIQPPPSSTPTATVPPLPQPSSTATATPTRTTPPTGPTSTPVLPPPTFNSCQADPNPAAAPNYPVRIVAIDKGAETVTLRNVTAGDTIDLAGWTMCSITGNQQHPIGGTLAPGQERTFPGPSGPIWNNSQRDDGALYTPSGQLASYFADR